MVQNGCALGDHHPSNVSQPKFSPWKQWHCSAMFTWWFLVCVWANAYPFFFFTLFAEICIYDYGHFPLQPLKPQRPKTTLYQGTLACGGCSVWWPTSPIYLGLRDLTAKTVAVPGKLKHSATKPQGHTLQGTKNHYFHDLGQVVSGPYDWVDRSSSRSLVNTVSLFLALDLIWKSIARLFQGDRLNNAFLFLKCS